MAATAASSLQIAASKSFLFSGQKVFRAGVAHASDKSQGASWEKLSISCHNIIRGNIFTVPSHHLLQDLTKLSQRQCKMAFIAGVADDNGYGWAIAKSLAAAGAEILVGTWVPGRSSRMCKAGFRSIDILVHSLANGSEVTKPLLETSRKGYLAAISASSYSYVSLLQHFLPIMNPGGSSISLTYIASERIIPGYGGGMSSAKAGLESDTRVLAFEAGRKHKVRVNTISAGPLRSRAAKAIGFIDMMIDYSLTNAPLQKELTSEEVGNTTAFLASPLASAITGAVIYVDNGLNAMGVAVDSPAFENLDIPKAT
ncbi:hypothetical protein RD792_003225 [Penstemon davidsonii]|uniref:Uncharacterized protein n=1 Tax=Penstemon davidsonii TaxID=160366 RepID=A0ABR0DT70_9LAMI|nr:hypothetical protein RD792_003225 [Penstemon davidsonii]